MAPSWALIVEFSLGVLPPFPLFIFYNPMVCSGFFFLVRLPPPFFFLPVFTFQPFVCTAGRPVASPPDSSSVSCVYAKSSEIFVPFVSPPPPPPPKPPPPPPPPHPQPFWVSALFFFSFLLSHWNLVGGPSFFSPPTLLWRTVYDMAQRGTAFHVRALVYGRSPSGIAPYFSHCFPSPVFA